MSRALGVLILAGLALAVALASGRYVGPDAERLLAAAPLPCPFHDLARPGGWSGR